MEIEQEIESAAHGNYRKRRYILYAAPEYEIELISFHG